MVMPKLKNTYLLSLSLLTISLPLPMVVSNFLIVLCLALRIISGGWKNTYRAISKSPEVWLMAGMFLMYVFSAMLSENKTEGWAIVERRLSLLVFPVLFFHPTVTRHIKRIMEMFVAGVVAALLYCTIVAIINFANTHDSGVWFYHQFSAPIKLNAVYLSAYAVSAFFFLLKEKIFPRIGNYGRIVLLTILVTGVLLLSSKMMLFILLAGGMLLLMKSKTNNKRILWITIPALIGVLISVPKLKERFSTEFLTNFDVVKQEQYRYDTPFTGTSLRLVIWKYCFRIQQQEQAWLLGVGTGDFQDLLNAKYTAHNMYTGNPELHDTGYLGYGPHNQYIEVFLSMGALGLCLFVLMLYLLVRRFLKTQDQTALLCAGLVIMFMLTESVLSTNKGIVFFCFLVTLFIARDNPELSYGTERGFQKQNN